MNFWRSIAYGLEFNSALHKDFGLCVFARTHTELESFLNYTSWTGILLGFPSLLSEADFLTYFMTLLQNLTILGNGPLLLPQGG